MSEPGERFNEVQQLVAQTVSSEMQSLITQVVRINERRIHNAEVPQKSKASRWEEERKKVEKETHRPSSSSSEVVVGGSSSSSGRGIFIQASPMLQRKALAAKMGRLKH